MEDGLTKGDLKRLQISITMGTQLQIPRLLISVDMNFLHLFTYQKVGWMLAPTGNPKVKVPQLDHLSSQKKIGNEEAAHHFQKEGFEIAL